MTLANKKIRFAIVAVQKDENELITQLKQSFDQLFFLDLDFTEVHAIKQILLTKGHSLEQIKYLQLQTKGLSDRDHQVLQALCDGLTSKEIGELIHVSKKTVDLIRTKLLKAYNVKSSNELIRLSIIDGLYIPRSNKEIQKERESQLRNKELRRKIRLA